MILLGMTGCSSENSANANSDNWNMSSDFDETKYLEEKSYEMVGNLQKIAADEEYIKLFTSSDSIAELAKSWSEAAIDKSEERYIIKPEGLVDLLSQYIGGESISATEKEVLEKKACISALNVINGRYGTDILAATSVAQYSRTYVPNGQVEDQMWILPTDNPKLYMAVSFSNTGEGAITAVAMYVIGEHDFSNVEKLLGK